mgnify:CR=1 FL=1
MTFYIFNKQDGTQGTGEYTTRLSEEILFEGDKPLDFNESQVGGFKLVEGVLVFDEALKQEKETKKLKQSRKQEILKQLDELDKKSIRSLREGNIERIGKLETQAIKLRAELQGL